MHDKNKTYAICFDLDETLGSFGQLYKFWHLLQVYLKNMDLDEKYFFNILDLFPEFLRTNIFKILKTVKSKKCKKTCNFVMIYTNNNGPRFWANLIRSYFHYKLKFKLFDQIIRAFKINGKRIEVCRTSSGKSYNDFISCTKLPPNTQLCFLDDQYHAKMEHENVLYINLKPYNYNVKYSVLCERFYKKNQGLFDSTDPANSTNPQNPQNLEHFIKFIRHHTHYDKLPYLNKAPVEKNIDKLITENIIKEINMFFKSPPKKSTRKRRKREIKNKTQKY